MSSNKKSHLDDFNESKVGLKNDKNLIPTLSRQGKYCSNSSTTLPVIQPNKIINKSKITKHYSKFNVSPTNSFGYISSSEIKVKNFYAKSVTGKKPEHPNRANQDSEFTVKDFFKQKNTFIFGVLDGHGPNGHLVSNYVKKSFLKNIEVSILKSWKCKDNLKRKFSPQISKFPQSTGFLLTPEIIMEAFRMTNNDICLSSIDINFSGTTFISVFIMGKHLICANVGDSRAIIGKYNRKWEAKALSRDHKPDEMDECERIVMATGVVTEFKDKNKKPIGPMRVWKRGEDYPGLAMSRSIGDKVAEEIGVIWVPEIQELDLDKEDKIIILASDGIWEHLSNYEAIEIAGEYWEQGDSLTASEELVKEAKRRWIEEDKTVIDDITVVVIFLK